MADQNRTVAFFLTARDGVTAVLKTVTSAVGGLGLAAQKVNSLFAPLQSTLLGVAAGYASISAARKGFDLAERQVNAEQRLSVALKGNTGLLKERLKVASEIQSKTTFGDEEVIEAEALLRVFGVSDRQIDVALKAVVNRAAAFGTDLQEQARQIGVNFATGLSGELGEKEPEVRLLGEAALKSGEQFVVLSKKYAGFAEKIASTDFGRVKQLNNAIGDVFERLGVIFARLQAAVLPRVVEVFDRFVSSLESPAGRDFLETLSRVLQFLISNVDKILLTLAALKGVSILLSVLSAVSTVVVGIVSAVTLLLNPITLVVAAAVAVGAAVFQAGIGFERLGEIGSQFFNKFLEVIKKIGEGRLQFSDLIRFVKSEVTALLLELGQAYGTPVLLVLSAVVGFIRGPLVTSLTLVKELVVGILEAVNKVLGFFGGSLGLNVAKLRTDANGLVDSVSTGLLALQAGLTKGAVLLNNGREQADKIRKANEVDRAGRITDSIAVTQTAKAVKEEEDYQKLLRERAELVAKLGAAEARAPKVADKDRLDQDEKNLENSYKNRLISTGEYLDRKDALETRGQKKELDRLLELFRQQTELREKLLQYEREDAADGFEDPDLAVQVNSTYAEQIALLDRIKTLQGQIGLIQEEQQNRRRDQNTIGKEISSVAENSLATAISAVVVNFKNARQAASAFFQSVAQGLADIAAKMLASAAIRSLFSALGGGGGFLGAFLNAPTGYNSGGAIAGLTPGEAVVPPSRVSRLGRPLLAAVNAMRLPLSALLDLLRGGFVPGSGPDADTVAGLVPVGGHVIRRRAVDFYGRGTIARLLGYNGGGEVFRGDPVFSLGNLLPALSAPPARSYAVTAGGGGPSGPAGRERAPASVIAHVPPTEQNLDRLLRGGDNAVVEAVGRNRQSIKRALGI